MPSGVMTQSSHGRSSIGVADTDRQTGAAYLFVDEADQLAGQWRAMGVEACRLPLPEIRSYLVSEPASRRLVILIPELCPKLVPHLLTQVEFATAVG